jgi:hypothetical protein
MRPPLEKTIAVLDDWQTFVCCRALVLLMDRKMAANPHSRRPPNLTVMDFHQWVRIGGHGVRTLVAALCERRLALTAIVGRQLMQACCRLGYADEVRSACQLANTTSGHLGTLSPVTIVAALAAILEWHPGCPPLKQLLQVTPSQRASRRRFPWLHSPPQSAAGRILEKET